MPARAETPLAVGGNAEWYWRILLGAVVAVILTAAAFSIDCPISAWCVSNSCPRELVRFLKLAEVFGNGIGVLVIVLIVHQLDPRRRPFLARVLVMSLGAGLAADGVKMLIARVRPRDFSFHGGVFTSFGDLFPAMSGGAASQSFPSAHTATAMGLAVALAWLYPRGRRLFVVLAVLVACQRVEAGYHFVSDTVMGAATGLLVGFGCLKDKRLARLFERLETHIAMRQAGNPSSPPAVPVRTPTTMHGGIEP